MRTLNDGTTIPVHHVVVWYADGSKQECTAATWVDLPSDGVVLVQVLYDYAYKGKWLQEVLRGHDYYWVHEGNLFNGRPSEIPSNIHESAIKHGKYVKDPEFLRMYNEARDGVAAKD